MQGSISKYHRSSTDNNLLPYLSFTILLLFWGYWTSEQRNVNCTEKPTLTTLSELGTPTQFILYHHILLIFLVVLFIIFMFTYLVFPPNRL